MANFGHPGKNFSHTVLDSAYLFLSKSGWPEFVWLAKVSHVDSGFVCRKAKKGL